MLVALDELGATKGLELINTGSYCVLGLGRLVVETAATDYASVLDKGVGNTKSCAGSGATIEVLEIRFKA